MLGTDKREAQDSRMGVRLAIIGVAIVLWAPVGAALFHGLHEIADGERQSYLFGLGVLGVAVIPAALCTRRSWRTRAGSVLLGLSAAATLWLPWLHPMLWAIVAGSALGTFVRGLLQDRPVYARNPLPERDRRRLIPPWLWPFAVAAMTVGVGLSAVFWPSELPAIFAAGKDEMGGGTLGLCACMAVVLQSSGTDAATPFLAKR